MGVLGEMFPSRKLRSEAGEAGNGQGWRLGPVDLDAGVVELYRADPAPAGEPTVPGPRSDSEDDEPDPTSGPSAG